MKEISSRTLLLIFYLISNVIHSQTVKTSFIVIDKANNLPHSNELFAKLDSALSTNYNLNTNNIYNFKLAYLSNASFILRIDYLNYCRYICIISDSLPKQLIDSSLNIQSGSCAMNDSVLKFTTGNMTIEIDRKSKKLLEFNRFKNDNDSIDFTSFNIDRTVFNGSAYDYYFPIQWYLNGNLKSNIRYENSYIYVTKYDSSGNLKSLLIYQMLSDEYGSNCILTKEINY